MDKNLELIKNVFRIMESGDLDELDKYIDANINEHTPDPAFNSEKEGLEGVKSILAKYKKIFPDLKVEIKELFGDGEKYVVYSVFKGTQKGKLKEIPPTNKKVAFENIDIFKISNGKITDHWGVGDNLGLMMQLGIITEKELQPH
ncbi:MAG: ester cyclase [Cytophagaceae bacterium]